MTVGAPVPAASVALAVADRVLMRGTVVVKRVEEDIVEDGSKSWRGELVTVR